MAWGHLANSPSYVLSSSIDIRGIVSSIMETLHLSIYPLRFQHRRIRVVCPSVKPRINSSCLHHKPRHLHRFATQRHLLPLCIAESNADNEQRHNLEDQFSHKRSRDHQNYDHHHHHRVLSCYSDKGQHNARDDGEVSKLQAAVIAFARAAGWYGLANYLREHVQLCCLSAALLLVAAVCPYSLPKAAPWNLVQTILIVIAVPLVGISACLDALVDVAGGKVNIHVLMVLAAFASALLGNILEGGLLLAMFNLAHMAEEYYTSRAMVDVKELKESYPDFALLVDARNNDLHLSDIPSRKIPVHDLDVGSFILIKAGELVPVDCEVVHGHSMITVQHLTGEIKPVERRAGDKIPGGGRNIDGVIIAQVIRTWKESTLSRILQMTDEAREKKPKLQRWLDEFGERYSKLVLLLSVVVAVGGPFLFRWPFFGNAACRGSIYRALGLMVAASPCALAVAPLVYFTAISACAKKGILLKGSHVLDALASCRVIAFDKTGTLTKGILKMKAVEPIIGHKIKDESVGCVPCCSPTCEEEALAVAAALGKGTTHPIARAVVNHADGRKLTPFYVEDFVNAPGRGISATLAISKSEIAGSEPVKASLGSVEYIASLCETKEQSGKVVDALKEASYGSDSVHAALYINEKVTLLHFEDEPRSGIIDVITMIKYQAKLRTVMLTGDHHSSAWSVANAVGIDEVYCCLKPDDKLEHVKHFSSNVGGLIMVGDGINDAPALAAATVGIVLAEHASATAVTTADVLLLQDNIDGVRFCVAKSRQATSLLKQNVVLALLCIIVAAFLSLLGFFPLWLTVLLHEGGTLIVCLNSTRALKDPS